jgi:hypothetical protein
MFGLLRSCCQSAESSVFHVRRPFVTRLRPFVRLVERHRGVTVPRHPHVSTRFGQQVRRTEKLETNKTNRTGVAKTGQDFSILLFVQRVNSLDSPHTPRESLMLHHTVHFMNMYIYDGLKIPQACNCGNGLHLASGIINKILAKFMCCGN